MLCKTISDIVLDFLLSQSTRNHRGVKSKLPKAMQDKPCGNTWT